MSITPILFSLLLLTLSPPSSATSTTSNLIHTSCIHATFPSLCVHTLSSSSSPTTTPREIAQAAVKVSLSLSSNTYTFLSSLLKTTDYTNQQHQKAALTDCVTQMSDSVDDLKKTLGELKDLRRATFRWQMSNVETWVSAALTNEDTCLDGFKEVDGQVRSDVKMKITKVARVTSNALYLINLLDQGSRT